MDYFLYNFKLCQQFRIGITHGFNQNRYQAVHEWFFQVQEGKTIPYGTAQNPPDNISGFVVRWELPVGNGKCNGTDVVGYHTHGHIGFVLRTITDARQFTNRLYNRLKNIRIVIRLFALHGHTKPLKTHTGIHMFVWERF